MKVEAKITTETAAPAARKVSADGLFGAVLGRIVGESEGDETTAEVEQFDAEAIAPHVAACTVEDEAIGEEACTESPEAVACAPVIDVDDVDVATEVPAAPVMDLAGLPLNVAAEVAAPDVVAGPRPSVAAEETGSDASVLAEGDESPVRVVADVAAERARVPAKIAVVRAGDVAASHAPVARPPADTAVDRDAIAVEHATPRASVVNEKASIAVADAALRPAPTSVAAERATVVAPAHARVAAERSPTIATEVRPSGKTEVRPSGKTALAPVVAGEDVPPAPPSADAPTIETDTPTPTVEASTPSASVEARAASPAPTTYASGTTATTVAAAPPLVDAPTGLIAASSDSVAPTTHVDPARLDTIAPPDQRVADPAIADTTPLAEADIPRTPDTERVEKVRTALEKLRPIPDGGVAVDIELDGVGRIELRVEPIPSHEGGGLRVSLGTDEPSALARLEAQRSELELALRHDGEALTLDIHAHGRRARTPRPPAPPRDAEHHAPRHADPIAPRRAGRGLVDVVA